MVTVDSAYCTLRLTRMGRGDGYRGRLRFANRPYTLIAPYASLAWGEGTVTVDDYAALIVPTRPNSIRLYTLPQAAPLHGGMVTAPWADGNAGRGCNPRATARGRSPAGRR